MCLFPEGTTRTLHTSSCWRTIPHTVLFAHLKKSQLWLYFNVSYIFSHLFLFLMPSGCFYVFLPGTFYTASATVMNFYFHIFISSWAVVPKAYHSREGQSGPWCSRNHARTSFLGLEAGEESHQHNTSLRICVGQTQNSSRIIQKNTTEWNNNSVTHCRTAGLSLIGGNDHIRQHKERIITLWKHEIIRWQRKSRC